MFRNEYKDNFISVGRQLSEFAYWTMLVERLDSSLRFSHDDDRNDATTYVCVWQMYRCNIRMISPTRQYDCQVYAILQHRVRRCYTR